ncbi:iron ABC transporter permease [Actinomyces radicidentis]|uniref:FecCD family ABC transporter permease n=1 Tax=Actinomyces radicidentis TaxID=111015 RepID=UPI0028E8F8C4|nr:iron ABC transporter permease [Actinomyces radicidentis]
MNAVASYRRRTARRAAILIGLAVVVAAGLVLALMVGPLPLGADDVLRSLLRPGADPSADDVVRQLRLPPAVLAVLVGAALSLAGAQMQVLLQNPLAEPFTLGVSAASALGAALAISAGLALPLHPGATVPAAALAGGLTASLVISLVSRMPGVTRETTVLLGIALVLSCQALLALVQYRASTESLQQIVFWSMGSLMRGRWNAVWTVGAALAVVAPPFWVNGWRLTALSLGEQRAAAMGVDVGRTRTRGLVGVCVLASLSVAFVGVIGFIGLVGPHVARGLVGEDQRFLIPASMLCGAALLTGAHVLSQVLVPGVAVPVGIVTALVGVPVFLAIVLGRVGVRRRAGA